MAIGAPEGDPPSRRGLAALGLAHRTCPDPAPPDRVAPSHGDASAHTPCLRTSPCATIAPAHTMPTKIVIRSRFFSTTDEPDNVEDTPPPNRSERPPPLPRCSRISSTSSKLVIINTTEISSDMESLGSGCGVASSVPDPARLVEPHPRVEDGVEDVNEQVGDDDRGRRDDDDPDDDRQVVAVDRPHGLEAQAGQAEDILGDDRTTQQSADVDAELRDDRRKRGAQTVPEDHPALGEPLGPRRADVVLPHHVEHRPAGEPG